MWKAIRSAVEAAVYSATGQDTSPALRTPFQFARATMIHYLVEQRDACSTLGAARVFPRILLPAGLAGDLGIGHFLTSASPSRASHVDVAGLLGCGRERRVQGLHEPEQ